MQKLNPDLVPADYYPQYRWLLEPPRIRAVQLEPHKWVGYEREKVDRRLDAGNDLLSVIPILSLDP